MPALALLSAPAVLVLGAALSGLIALRGRSSGRLVAAASVWVALGLVVVEWVGNRTVLELFGPQLGAGAPLSFRLDALSFAFSLFLLAPAAVLLSAQARSGGEAALATLAVVAGLLLILAGGFTLAALLLGCLIVLLMVQLRMEHQRGSGQFWPWAAAAWVGLLLAAASLQAGGGTALYTAVPVQTVNGAVFALIAAAGMVIAGLLPWRAWPGELWDRPRLQAAGVTNCLLVPIGMYLLVRAVDVAEGHFPTSWLGPALMLLGLAVIVAASIRAQAAASRRSYLAEMIPATGGFALLALGAGAPLGLTGALATAAALSLLSALIPLIPDRPSAAGLLATGLAAGFPPGLIFAVRLLDLGVAFEANETAALAAIVAASAWILGLAGAARAARLPGLLGGEPPSPPGVASAALSIAALIGGAALGAILTAIAVPAANEVLRTAAGPGGGSAAAVVSASGSWPGLALGAPLLGLGLLLLVASRPSRRVPVAGGDGSSVEPFFRVPGASGLARLQEWARSVRIPADYRSLLPLRSAHSALGSGRPILWLAVLAALIVAVTR